MSKQSLVEVQYPGHLTSRPSAKERMNALISADDPEARVQALEAWDLLQIIEEVGLVDAQDIALLASPDQIQRIVDLDVWRKASFAEGNLVRWLETYLQLEESRFKTLYEELDPEVLPIFLKRHIRVWLADEDGQVPDDAPPDASLVASPDHTYYILYPEDEGLARLCRVLIDKVYDTLGVMKGWAMLESTRWELDSEMESQAYHFRKARLEEMGFRAAEEAVAVYAWLDPVKLRRGLERAAAEAELSVERDEDAGALDRADDDDEAFFARAVSRLLEAQPEALARLERELLTLGNLTASADLVDVGARRALERNFRRTTATLELGLEFLARGDVERAAQVLEQAPLREIFRAGFGLTATLQRQAREMIERGQISVVEELDASLLSDPERELIDALTAGPRPMRERHVEAGWFRSHRDIEDAARILARVGLKELFFFGVLRLDLARIAQAAYHERLALAPAAVSFDALFATLVLRDAIGAEASPEPIEVEAVSGLSRADIDAAFDDWLERELLPPQAAPSKPLLDAFIEESRAGLLESWPEGSVDPRFVTGALLLTPA